ncbi:bifunctional DNA-binding transcriptional regulator/O6-methylguanine-DNA methyltransferase Ada [Edaphobacter sp. HDX4]|uniref:bifunctional DNA-binding transcriptional regulator/O6-methylguanine-DNA methyltransferase Ada n=1 Tax=Edaphobacter sp. HDX4 TaxID=2794064 RepID=UPI002FE614FB
MAMSAGEVTDILPGKQWQQVLERDPGADGRFYYAVRSTGIVCKPSCPSRRPSRANVHFFPTLAEALEAGFRPCRRCHPDRVAATPDPQAEAVGRAARYIQQHAGERITTEGLAKAAGVNRLTLHRAFKRIFGVSPAAYARQKRLKDFDTTIRESIMTVTDAIYDAGFGSSSRLYENSNARLGMTPREMRNGAHGIAIRYATADSPLGRMLVAATEKGVCTIAFGNDDTELTDVLRGRFPNAALTHETPKSGWLSDAIDFITGQMGENPGAASFPLDVRATAFQQRVWSALQQIPRGETRSYSQLAAQLGSPTATRAVAGACAANPVAIIVPCHRVVGKDGSLTGFRWGTERKRKLLEAEKAVAHLS